VRGANASRRDSGRLVGRAKSQHRGSKVDAAGLVKQSSTHDLPSKRFRNHQQSEIVEMFVAQELIARGWNIAYPRSSHSPFDLIAVKDNYTLRVQVKSTRQNRSNCRVWDVTRYRGATEKTTSGRQPLSCRDCDVIALVYAPLMELFFVPSSKVTAQHFIIGKKNRDIYLRNFANLKPCLRTRN
jgi:PD-(D/E)XK endonuclease